jgi:lysophospholipase L1-like esterase
MRLPSTLIGALGAVALFASACGGDGGDPVGLVVLGHSAVTGFNADPEKPRTDAPRFSWATGDEPAVNSVYLRMVQLLPETEGEVFNGARGGATSATPASQAERALEEQPDPKLILIMTIDNDIQCDGSDEANLPRFGANVSKALDAIAEAAPDAKVLFVTFFGRPSPEDVEAITAAAPDLKEFVTGDGECSWYSPDGEINPESFANFNAIVDGYEAELERVCAEYEQCRTDGGAAGEWVDDPIADYSDDYTHLNQQGLASFAAHMWPVVEAVLNEE